MSHHHLSTRAGQVSRRRKRRAFQVRDSGQLVPKSQLAHVLRRFLSLWLGLSLLGLLIVFFRCGFLLSSTTFAGFILSVLLTGIGLALLALPLTLLLMLLEMRMDSRTRVRLMEYGFVPERVSVSETDGHALRLVNGETRSRVISLIPRHPQEGHPSERSGGESIHLNPGETILLFFPPKAPIASNPAGPETREDFPGERVTYTFTSHEQFRQELFVSIMREERKTTHAH